MIDTQDILSLIYRVQSKRTKLSKRDLKIVDSLVNYFESRGSLSVRQVQVLRNLANKTCSIERSKMGRKIKRTS